MIKKRTYRVVMAIDVTDEAALKAAAKARALAEGLTEAEWGEIRFDTCTDLELLLDPGSGPGFGVFNARASPSSSYRANSETAICNQLHHSGLRLE